MTADDTTHPPTPMPTERGTAVENESERHMTGPEQMAARALNETTDPTGRCADCGGAGVIEVESADEHRDFMACSTCTPAGPVENESDEVCWLNEDCIAGPHTHRVQCRFPSWQADAAEPDAGEALNEIATLALAEEIWEDEPTDAEQLLMQRVLTSDWLAARDAEVYARALRDANKVAEAALAEVARDTAEQIAQAIEAKYLGPDSGRGYDGSEAPDAHCRNAYDEGLYDAARIARETR